MNIIERLKIPIVLESELHGGYTPVTISLALSDPDVANMWSTLKSCGAVATMDDDGRITFWREMPRPVYIGKREWVASLSGEALRGISGDRSCQQAVAGARDSPADRFRAW
jgi:hypothetical protein